MGPLTRRSRALSAVAPALAGLTALYWAVVLVGSVGEVVEALPGANQVIPLTFFFGVSLAMTPTDGVIGFLGLSTGIPSRLVGLLVLGPAVVFRLSLSRAAPNVVIDVGHALFHLGLAGAVRTAGAPTRTGEATHDSPA
jgi:hypothetical protein